MHTEHKQRLAELSRQIASVREDERRRWAAELHDLLGANLAAIGLNLKAIEKSIPAHDADGRELLGETRGLLRDTIVSVREFGTSLRPALLEQAGLVPALSNHIEQFKRRAGMQASFDHTGFTGRCPAELELALYRIAQEALLNCVKHSRATRVAVTLTGSPDHLRMAIEDDGIGIEATMGAGPDSSAGHGMLNMQERAASAGGVLTVDSAAGSGTCVRVEIN